MYAIVQIGGRQYRAAPGQRVVVDRLDVEPGAELQLEDVRMVVAEAGDSGTTMVGTPRLSTFQVTATAVSHLRGPKVLVFKYKPKKRYRRQRGFRADLTEIRIESIASIDAGSVKTAEHESSRSQPVTAAEMTAESRETAPVEDTKKSARATTPRKRQGTKPSPQQSSEVAAIEEDGDGA